MVVSWALAENIIAERNKKVKLIFFICKEFSESKFQKGNARKESMKCEETFL